VLLVWALTCVGPAAADQWHSVDASNALSPDPAAVPGEPSVTVLASGPDGLRVAAATPGLDLEDVSAAGGQFVRVSWPDSPYFGEIGTPALPVIRRLFVVPAGARVSLSVQAGAAAALGQPILILPVQPPIPKTPGALENAEFQFDPLAYALDADLPAGLVQAEELGIVRGQRLWLLEIRPVTYNAARQALTFYGDVIVDVQFVGGEPADGQMSAPPGLGALVLNPEILPAEGRGTGNYLIVVASAYESAIASFAGAKASMGYTVSTHAVAAGTTNSQIKSYIQGLWGDPQTRPDYLLLVGDTDTIPHWVGVGSGSPATDLYYACMDGSSDWYPDIAIGRFPVRNATHLDNMVTKTLYYETGPLADPDYMLRAVFMASQDNYQITEGTHNWVINNHMTPRGIASDKLYCHTYNATTQQVTNSFNNGRFFAIFSGHGDVSYWADGPYFTQSNVNALVNQNMYAFVCSFSCLTGQFTSNECFMETWVRAANKGAVTAWGSSVTSYWTEDDILEKRLFDSIYDANDAVPAYVGPILNDTKLRYLAHFGSGGSTRRYFEMYNLMGDPALPMFGPETPPHGLKVTPEEGLAATGPLGGPFTPDSVVFTLENKGEVAFDYQVTATQPWLTVTNGTGTLGGQAMAVVTVSINAQANLLGTGMFYDTISFTNLTDHDGDTTRPVSLKVGVPTLRYAWNLDTNPGWPMQGQWAWGQPTGQGGTQYGYPDPQSGATGTKVIGVNLSGDYSTAVGGPWYVTLGPVDLSNTTEASVRFQRWLNSDYQPYVYATIEASNNGTSWTQVWSNGSSEIKENAWSLRQHDLSAVADNQPAVWVRWGYRVASGAYAYSGWNLDDVEIWGLLATGSPFPLGDLNCDHAVDFGDINPFVMAVTDAAAYQAAFPGCNVQLADINGDGEVNFGDINPFVALLAQE
jgi:hypothetical protein